VSHLFLVPTILTHALAEMEGMKIARVTTHSEKAAPFAQSGKENLSIKHTAANKPRAWKCGSSRI
jgi:hypothetical protein